MQELTRELTALYIEFTGFIEYKDTLFHKRKKISEIKIWLNKEFNALSNFIVNAINSEQYVDGIKTKTEDFLKEVDAYADDKKFIVSRQSLAFTSQNQGLLAYKRRRGNVREILKNISAVDFKIAIAIDKARILFSKIEPHEHVYTQKYDLDKIQTFHKQLETLTLITGFDSDLTINLLREIHDELLENYYFRNEENNEKHQLIMDRGLKAAIGFHQNNIKKLNEHKNKIDELQNLILEIEATIIIDGPLEEVASHA